MDIFDLMDCQDCINLKPNFGRTECKKGAPDNGPCSRMLGTIHDLINDGYLETANGQFHTKELLQEDQKDKDSSGDFQKHDFSSALYFWVPFNMAMKHIRAYRDEKEIFNDWFV
jgi:hypothetical protein